MRVNVGRDTQPPITRRVLGDDPNRTGIARAGHASARTGRHPRTTPLIARASVGEPHRRSDTHRDDGQERQCEKETVTAPRGTWWWAGLSPWGRGTRLWERLLRIRTRGDRAALPVRLITGMRRLDGSAHGRELRPTPLIRQLLPLHTPRRCAVLASLNRPIGASWQQFVRYQTGKDAPSLAPIPAGIGGPFRRYWGNKRESPAHVPTAHPHRRNRQWAGAGGAHNGPTASRHRDCAQAGIHLALCLTGAISAANGRVRAS